jgi:hypothetical protein
MIRCPVHIDVYIHVLIDKVSLTHDDIATSND